MIYNLASLIKIDIILDILQEFHDLTGMRSILKDAEGNIIASLIKNQGRSPYCSCIHAVHDAACIESDRNATEQAIRLKCPLIYRCHAGLTDVVIPLFIEDEFVGAVFTGQFATIGDEPVDFGALEAKFELRKDALRDTFGTVPSFDRKVMEFYVNMLNAVFRWVISLRLRYIKDLKYQENMDINVYDRIEKAIRIMNENYGSALTMKDAAHQVNLSESYFSTSFKEYTGISFPEYLNKIRIEKARFLLKSTYLSVTTIAYDVGYSDSNYFSTIFKKLTGLTPKQFREKYDLTCPNNYKTLEEYRKKHGLPGLEKYSSFEDYRKNHDFPEDMDSET
jgi:AraC-like DNA-binding protein/ligand-binding sensor protein